MKRACVFILLLAFFGSAAQLPYEKVFQVTSTLQLEVCFKSVEISNAEIISCGTNDACSPCPTTNYLTRLDSNGNTIWQKLFYPGNIPIPIDFAITLENDIVFLTGSESIDSLGNVLIYFSVYKVEISNGALIDSNEFQLVFYQNHPTMIQLFAETDSTISMFTGEHRLKLNSQLDTFNVHSYNSPLSKAIRTGDDNHFLLPTFSPAISSDSSVFEIITTDLDSIGKIYIPDSIYEFFDVFKWNSLRMISTQSNNYYFTAYKSQSYDSIVVGLLDSTLNKIWINKIPVQPFTTSILELYSKNGNLILTGENNHASGPSGNAYIVGFDNNGDTILYKSYKAYNFYAFNKFFHVTMMNDNGYLLSGTTSDPVTVPQSSYIVRTDSSGNTPFTINVNFVNENKESVLIFPSVSAGLFHINCNTENNYSISVINQLGICIQQIDNIDCEGSIDLSSLKSGIYLVNFISKNNLSVKRIVKL